LFRGVIGELNVKHKSEVPLSHNFSLHPSKSKQILPNWITERSTHRTLGIENSRPRCLSETFLPNSIEPGLQCRKSLQADIEQTLRSLRGTEAKVPSKIDYGLAKIDDQGYLLITHSCIKLLRLRLLEVDASTLSTEL